MSRTSVLVFGATGRTGKSVVDALLSDPSSYRVVIAVRSSSLSKPEIAEFVNKGVETRQVDIAEGASEDEELLSALKDIDIVVSAIVFDKLKAQYPLIDAAKKAGVKRFVPSDWSPLCTRGVRAMHDEKLAIHDYIINLGLGYTFIDAAYWFNLPPLNPSNDQPSAYELPKHIFGSGDVKYTTIHIADIGPFVARILRDPRTLNRYVYCYAEEVTQNEVFDLARRVTGKEFKPVHVSEEQVKELIRKTRGIPFEFEIWEYVLSIWFRGDSAVENAKKPEYGGALDAKELYPDVKLHTLEEYAKEFYQV